MKFEQVTLIGEANVYFGGKVSSRTFYVEDGVKKTLGFVTAGEYEFSTDTVEHMEMLQGELQLKLPNEKEYVTYKQGDVFDIPKGISFFVKTDSFADYCCTYI